MPEYRYRRSGILVRALPTPRTSRASLPTPHKTNVCPTAAPRSRRGSFSVSSTAIHKVQTYPLSWTFFSLLKTHARYASDCRKIPVRYNLFFYIFSHRRAALALQSGNGHRDLTYSCAPGHSPTLFPPIPGHSGALPISAPRPLAFARGAERSPQNVRTTRRNRRRSRAAHLEQEGHARLSGRATPRILRHGSSRRARSAHARDQVRVSPLFASTCDL